MGSQLSKDESFKVLDKAYEKGLRFLDTAEGYPTVMRPATHGQTEFLLGDWIRSRDLKDILINTKVFGPGDVFRGGKTTLDRDEIRLALEGSMERLGLPCIDCYMLHWISNKPDEVEDVAGTMKELMQEGKILSWGLSNTSYEGYEMYVDASKRLNAPPPSIVQNRYSYGVDPTGVGQAPVPLMAYGVLRYGSFSGKYLDGALPKGSRLPWLRDNFGVDISHLKESPIVDEVIARAESLGISPVQVAIDYVIRKPFTKNLVLGVTTTEQLDHALSTPVVRDILRT